MSPDESPRSSSPRSPRFATTCWSLVFVAGEGESPAARRALGDLCEAYWPPLYTFLRRRGCSPHQAEDVAQGFFARLLEKGDLADAVPERGRFRSFLLAAAKHYLANERDKERAAKRGGGRTPVSLDVDAAEARYAAAASTCRPPEALFAREWALTTLERARARLRAEFVGAGKVDRFDKLAPYLGGDATGSVRLIAAELDLTENAAKVALHRLRARFRQTLRDEIALTVATEEAIDDEIRDLFDALRGSPAPDG